jgi:hypothetical protein
VLAAIGAAISGDAEAAPEEFEFALAVAAGDPLQIEIAAARAMGAKHVANGDLGPEEAQAAFAASPGTKTEDTDGVIANAAPMGATTRGMIAMGADHRSAP